MRVAIDCRINDFRQGIGTAVQALAKALSDSKIEDQEYYFITYESMRDHVGFYTYGPCRVLTVPEPKLDNFKAALRWITPLRILWKKLRGSKVRIPISDGFVESKSFDLVHFPTQVAYQTELPSIYQPWDLQHLHYPEFFSADEFAHREATYRKFCEQAAYVCVQTEWTKCDIMNHYKLLDNKLEVIPWGSIFDAYREPSEQECEITRSKFNLPQYFFFYPAVTWPHKNHEVILRALQIYNSHKSEPVHVYFTGASTEHRAVLEVAMQDLQITNWVHFLGFVSPEELQAIFHVATAMIFPSRFEGFGLPILEAFHAHLPVLASNASTLPEVAKDAALYFSPDSPDELAKLMDDIISSPSLRSELIDKGSEVLAGYSMEKTAARFQLLYAKVAAESLTGRGIHKTNHSMAGNRQ